LNLSKYTKTQWLNAIVFHLRRLLLRKINSFNCVSFGELLTNDEFLYTISRLWKKYCDSFYHERITFNVSFCYYWVKNYYQFGRSLKRDFHPIKNNKLFVKSRKSFTLRFNSALENNICWKISVKCVHLLNRKRKSPSQFILTRVTLSVTFKV
jgi:hypothetical protein